MHTITSIKIGLISSKGGHLLEMEQLQSVYKQYARFWVTYPGADTNSILKNEKNIHYAFFPESRNIINAIRNFFLAFVLFLREKPTILISCGAGIAVPFFIVGKIFFRTKLIYIESFDFVKYPSLTGKLIYKFADLFLIQHICQKKWYPKAKYWGSIL